MAAQQTRSMGTGRALTTDSERGYLAGEEGSQRKSEAKSRIGTRIEEILKEDMEHFSEHAPILNEKLQETVCDGDVTITDPVRTLRELSKQLGQPIVVGEQMFEDGDVHPIDGDTS